jgi:uncharacterized protein (TIGR03382 family)
MRRARSVILTGLGLLVGCGGSCGTDLGPVPGGFPGSRKIEQAVQVRLTPSGLRVLAQTLAGEVTGTQSVPLTTSTQGSLTVCPASATGCALQLAVDDLALAPRPGQGLLATLPTRVSAQVALRDAQAGLDCLVSVSGATAAPVEADVDLGVHGPSGAVTVDVSAVRLNLPAGAVTVAADPLTGDAADAAACPGAGLGGPVVAQLEGLLAPALRSGLAAAFGWRCQSDPECPGQATCDPGARLCVEDGSGRVLSDPLAYETRLQIPALLGELGYRGTSGQVDTAVSVGGRVSVDAQGLALGIRAGAETVTANPQCATITESPVVRPTFTPPVALPATEAADLDFDGVPESPYDLVFGLSQDVLQQIAWSVYTSGLLCGIIGQEEFSDLSTETLQLLIPSVRFLTRSHLFPRSEAPARLSVYMRREPKVVVGTGEVRPSGDSEIWYEPLVRLDLDDVELNVSALIDERWLRILTVTLDIHIGIGANPTPGGGIEPLLGVGVANLVTDVRVTHSELLAEPPESLESSIPTLISLLILDLTGSQGEVELPDIPGFDLTLLGLRGEPGPGGGAPQTVAAYAAAQPVGQGNLHIAAETHIRAATPVVPPTEAFRVTHPGGPVVPSVRLSLEAEVPAGAVAEYQIRVDGGPWRPFVARAAQEVSDPIFLLQGRHTVEARARVRGDYHTLDVSPARVEVWIDSEAPELSVAVDAARGGVVVDAWDRLSPVSLALVSDAGRREILPGVDGFAAVPELSEAGALAVEARDEAGLTTQVVLRAASSATPAGTTPGLERGGCTAGGSAEMAGLLLVLGAALFRRRRA